MCLILFAVAPSANQRLVVAANRDEQHGRPTQRAGYWDDAPHILGGRDLQAGGTWLGVTRGGRFAAVTNFRETPADPMPPRSRGELTADFLRHEARCEDYLADIESRLQDYLGFNLLIDDGHSTWYCSNRGAAPLRLVPGVYGLSNQLLDCNWPKVNQGRAALADLAQLGFPDDDLFDLLAYEGGNEPFSARFIRGEQYGTSASTVVKFTGDQVAFLEQGFAPQGEPTQRRQFKFTAGSGS